MIQPPVHLRSKTGESPLLLWRGMTLTPLYSRARYPRRMQFILLGSPTSSKNISLRQYSMKGHQLSMNLPYRGWSGKFFSFALAWKLRFGGYPEAFQAWGPLADGWSTIRKWYQRGFLVWGCCSSVARSLSPSMYVWRIQFLSDAVVVSTFFRLASSAFFYGSLNIRRGCAWFHCWCDIGSCLSISQNTAERHGRHEGKVVYGSILLSGQFYCF